MQKARFKIKKTIRGTVKATGRSVRVYYHKQPIGFVVVYNLLNPRPVFRKGKKPRTAYTPKLYRQFDLVLERGGDSIRAIRVV